MGNTHGTNAKEPNTTTLSYEGVYQMSNVISQYLDTKRRRETEEGASHHSSRRLILHEHHTEIARNEGRCITAPNNEDSKKENQLHRKADLILPRIRSPLLYSITTKRSTLEPPRQKNRTIDATTMCSQPRNFWTPARNRKMTHTTEEDHTRQ